MTTTRMQIVCLWSAPIFIILYLMAFVGISEFVPPPGPSLSADEIVAIFNENRNGIRLGQILCLMFSILYMPWIAVVTLHMARVEGRYPVMAILSLVGAAVLFVWFMLCSIIWSIAAFRPDLTPETVMMLNDAAWLLFVLGYPEYILQLGCMAFVFLRDKRPTPFLPRWACYFTLMVCFVGSGGMLATFFKAGPFAWNGIIGFWLPISFFSIWIFVMLPQLIKGVKAVAGQDAMEDAARSSIQS